MITIEQLKDLKERVEALNRYLAIDEKVVELEEEELRTQAPGFWDNQKEAEAQMKKVKDIQKWITGYREVQLPQQAAMVVLVLVVVKLRQVPTSK